ncbi:hypothetical protein FSP39_024423 [Pinctada imbricata]|uniref:Calcineurin-like phosphoesterase domain-containing protein n=1 Tax=Pinctada imbricata TaxID=66713 RepID=A0AA88XKA7_PINIB|nr:hypothetical protein FSP39_024423 [Pinctada imbricata]
MLFYCFVRGPTLPGELEPGADFNRPLKVMFIADTHILGWREGHWFDKLRREWQMRRSFQTSMTIHHPDVVFILGDLLDEGKWCPDEEFNYHVTRFKKMFATPPDTELYFVSGNHDVGFHYRMTEPKLRRFEKAFSAPSVQLLTIRDNLFVLVNSMALEGDGCLLCQEAEQMLKKISQQLRCAQGKTGKTKDSKKCSSHPVKFKYSKPILLQHFPMYRPSDAMCKTLDSAPPAEKYIPFKPRWDSLSEEASKQLFDWINPRLIVSAHTHHGCHRIHDDGTPEWTVASFSWRNKREPTFLLTVISNTDYAVSQCFLPSERTVITLYISGGLICLLSLFFKNKSLVRYNGSLGKAH